MRARLKKLSAEVRTSHIIQTRVEEAIKMNGKMPPLSSFMFMIIELAVQDWSPQETGPTRKSKFQRMIAVTFKL